MKLKLIINPYKMFVTYTYVAPNEVEGQPFYSYDQDGFVLKLLPEDKADKLVETGWEVLKEMRLPKWIYRLFKDAIVAQEAKLLIHNKNSSQKWRKMSWELSLPECSSIPSGKCFSKKSFSELENQKTTNPNLKDH